ncbi:hypothetical protein POG22_16350 [Geitlerinema sp. CS-897]|nr:hypothetical protein [Geitlerinema sp. CS-897]
MSQKQNFDRVNFSSNQKLEIVRALLERGRVSEDARKAFRIAYPKASDAAISTAVFHVYVDGIYAALDWLVDVELFLQDPHHRQIDRSEVFHLIYHLYNYLQFIELLPENHDDFLEKIEDIRAAIEASDKSWALSSLDDLSDQVKGSVSPPNFWKD